MNSRRNARPCVLLVDDMPDNIALLADMLDTEGYELLFARDGLEALELAYRETPDVVLLDVVMPGLDGYEVCRRLKQDPQTRDCAVLFVTGQDDIDAEIRGLEAGAVDYLSKPLTPAIVRMRVRNHVELKCARDRLSLLAISDGLTGLCNRRGFDDRLQAECQRQARLKRPLSLLLLDIDHFKAYNDTYGHLAGDACLQRVAQVMMEIFRRPADLTARYGGEEFACILPDTGQEGAQILAEQLRNGIARLAIPHRASPTADHVTASIGGISLFCSADTPPYRVIELADQALYRAKQKGRNQIYVSALR